MDPRCVLGGAARFTVQINRQVRMTIYRGHCHCGNIELVFETEIAPHEIEVRACQCSFCRKHASRAIADPAGLLTISVCDDQRLQRYRFGFGTAEYLLCRECGVYTAAITTGEAEPRAIVIINALDDHRLFTRDPLAVDYDQEGRGERIGRRRERWMPVSVRSGRAP
jgi:hypothetical protein